MAKASRVLFHAIDTVGIGHLSRLLGVAEALTQYDSEIQPIFLSESSSGILLEDYPFPYFQIPPYHATLHSDRWKGIPGLPSWKAVVQSILRSTSPGLLLYDTYIWEDLWILAKNEGIRQAALLRNRSDLRHYVVQNKRLLRDLEFIVFPHQEEEIACEVRSLLPAGLDTVFSGPIVRRSLDTLNTDLSLEDFGLMRDLFTIVVTNGGGNSLPSVSDRFIQSALDAIDTVCMTGCIDRGVQVVVVLGPLANATSVLHVNSVERLQVHRFLPNLLELFTLANLVIARGGYNTVHELMQIGVPSICVPARRQTDNQSQRIAHASMNRTNIHVATLNSEALRSEIERVVGSPRWMFSRETLDDTYAENKVSLARTIAECVRALRTTAAQHLTARGE